MLGSLNLVPLLFLYSFQDNDKKLYKCRVAFQVLIKPGSYKIDKETLGYGQKQIDSEFDNSEIEWSTKQYGTTILYGLLIKAEPTMCVYQKICQRFLKTLSLPGSAEYKAKLLFMYLQIFNFYNIF